MEYTPGPWKVEKHPATGKLTIEAEDPDSSFGPDIAHIADDRYMTPQEHDANARLIEKAPEILQCLDELLTQTVDADLKYGIGLSEGEGEVRNKALKLFAYISGG